MIETVYAVIRKYCINGEDIHEIYMVFKNKKVAEQWIAHQGAESKHLTVQQYVVWKKLPQLVILG